MTYRLKPQARPWIMPHHGIQAARPIAWDIPSTSASARPEIEDTPLHTGASYVWCWAAFLDSAEWAHSIYVIYNVGGCGPAGSPADVSIRKPYNSQHVKAMLLLVGWLRCISGRSAVYYCLT